MRKLKKFSKKYVITKRKRLLRVKNHPFMVPVVTLLVLLFITAVAFLTLGGKTVAGSDQHIVIVSYDHKQQTLPTRASDVGDLLKRLKITLNQGDIVEPSVATPIVEDNFRVNVYRARPVTIIDNGHRIQALSAATTPRSIAQQAGLTVYPEDDIKATVATDSILKDQTIGEEVVINRATPVYINLYGTQVTVRTHAKTVADLLKEKNIKLSSSDTLQPAATTPLIANTQVFVVRQGTQIITVAQAIPPPTQTVEDDTLSFGTTVVRQQGVPGQQLVTYQIDLQNGKEIGRHVIQVVTAQEPVQQIIARGQAVQIPADKTTLMAAAGIAQSDYPYVNYIVSRESGWCPTKWQGEIGYCPAYFEAIHPVSAIVGYGLCQSTPADKMASAGSDWEANPVTQLRWCSGYASRYGGWAGSYQHWLNYHSW